MSEKKSVTREATTIDEAPADSPHHNVLILSPKSELYEFKVEHSGEKAGTYAAAPELKDFRDPGYRKVYGIATAGADDPSVGPAIATMPRKPEPASSYWTCYLVNTKNLNYQNPWIAANWSASALPSGEAAGVDAGPPELVVAGEDGHIYHLVATAADRLDLEKHPEIWQQLRNGTVAGRVRLDGRVVPLVNVSSLNPAPNPSECD
jgi:hypothetical protein